MQAIAQDIRRESRKHISAMMIAIVMEIPDRVQISGILSYAMIIWIYLSHRPQLGLMHILLRD